MRKGKQKVLQAHIDQLQKEGDAMAKAIIKFVDQVDFYGNCNIRLLSQMKSNRDDFVKALGSRKPVRLK